jgi:ABC-type taurine transport system ATPase subunit
MPVTDVGGGLILAAFADPDGLPVGLVQTSSVPGPSVGTGEAVDWFEVMGSDAERTQNFYSDLFGWATEDLMPEEHPGSYILGRVRGRDAASSLAKLAPMIEVLELTADLDRFVAGYSLGMKKKLALLVALAHSPQLLLLDEPTNGLDPPSAVKMRRHLQELAKGGVTVVLSTHLLDMADKLCTRVLLMDHGRLIFDGAPLVARQAAQLGPDASLEDAFLKLVAA